MDAKTTVKPQRELIVPSAQGWYSSAHEYSGEHNYSPGERLLFMENALNHTENALFASNQKLAEQEKHVELGRLAVKVNICNELFSYGSTNCLNHRCCKDEYDFCQKRAELLTNK